MDGLSLQAMSNRATSVVREKLEKRKQEQRKVMLYLVAQFFSDQGYYKSLDTLTTEAGLTSNFEICDNVDLHIVLQEWIDYYLSRFNKMPEILKRTEAKVAKENSVKFLASPKDAIIRSKAKLKSVADSEDSPLECAEPDLVVVQLSGNRKTDLDPRDVLITSNSTNEIFLKPLGKLYPPNSEWREIAEVITREIVLTKLDVHWDDICGLDECKEFLKESVVYPRKYPQFFTDLFTPRKGVLLYGPPGTGKTMLAKAVATECDCTFFNISASSLVSKWRGDSEKYIRVLYELASYHAPSVIFIDEIDWIAAGDGAVSSDRAEPARRFRAELLLRLDGLKSDESSHVLLLAATNAPWNLDSALLRRLENHILVDLPGTDARRKILKIYTDEKIQKSKDFEDLVKETKGFSSAELTQLCKQAWMIQMRKIWSELERGTRKYDQWLEEKNSIRSCESLRVAIENMLLTANPLKNKYEEWKRSLQNPPATPQGPNRQPPTLGDRRLLS